MSNLSGGAPGRSRIVAAVVLIALVVAAITFRNGLTAWLSGSRAAPRADESGSAGGDLHEPAADGGETDHYTCSMHPSVHQSGPGKCPICGMELIPVSKEQVRAGVVTIPAARQQLIGVRTSEVRSAKMVRSLRAIGRLTYDESKLTDVSLKVRGWIVKLFVTNTGERVRRGQTLFTLYSPELYAAQQDFLLAGQGQPALPGHHSALARSARQRLRLLDLSDSQIDAIARSGEPLENVPFTARETGFVIEKNVVEGGAVEPGMRLYRLAALDKVWIEADVYEADFASVRVGQTASVTLDYVPGRSYDARVAYVYPYLNAATRTGRVRLELANQNLELRPGMYANVELEIDLGTRLQLPAAAIIYTGPRRLVFVDLGEGRFRPQEVVVGAEAHGMYEVLSGLKAGDRVASSGVFLIAAEARISSAATYWESGETGDIGAAVIAPPPADSESEAHPADAPHERKTLAVKSAHAAARSAKISVAPHEDHTASQASREDNTPSQQSASGTDALYTCPMHPEVTSPTPGTCPKCGMKLERATPEVPQ